jgi:hypothetical protein
MIPPVRVNCGVLVACPRSTRPRHTPLGVVFPRMLVADPVPPADLGRVRTVRIGDFQPQQFSLFQRVPQHVECCMRMLCPPVFQLHHLLV